MVSQIGMPIKVNKKQFIRKLKAAIKARKQAQTALTAGLFAPTEHDLKEELSSMPSYKAKVSYNDHDSL